MGKKKLWKLKGEYENRPIKSFKEFKKEYGDRKKKIIASM